MECVVINRPMDFNVTVEEGKERFIVTAKLHACSFELRATLDYIERGEKIKGQLVRIEYCTAQTDGTWWDVEYAGKMYTVMYTILVKKELVTLDSYLQYMKVHGIDKLLHIDEVRSGSLHYFIDAAERNIDDRDEVGPHQKLVYIYDMKLESNIMARLATIENIPGIENILIEMGIVKLDDESELDKKAENLSLYVITVVPEYRAGENVFAIYKVGTNPRDVLLVGFRNVYYEYEFAPRALLCKPLEAVDGYRVSLTQVK